MIRRIDIVNRINNMYLARRITWDDISYDADSAITRINDFMGTKYPDMSTIMLYDHSTYSIEQNGVNLAIFPEEYIRSIVIPFIALELLARDEEFTTVYTKYANDVDSGLFNMFQKEFNSVPYVFRQNPDNGVFFGVDAAYNFTPDHNSDVSLPTFKFTIKYELGITEPVVMDTTMIADITPYEYGSFATVKNMSPLSIATVDGLYVYEFEGWHDVPSTSLISAGAKLEMLTSKTLVAQWNRIPTYTISNNILTVLSAHRNILHTFRGDLLSFTTINEDSFVGTELETLYLPSTLTTIYPGALDSATLKHLYISEAGNTEVTIYQYAIICSSMESLLIPNRVTVIQSSGVNINNHGKVYCRVLLENIPVGWALDWTTNPAVEYGYNGRVV